MKTIPMFVLWVSAVNALPAVIPGEFRQIDCDAGGWFTGFATHASGRVYGRTDVGGCYRSDDAGSTWRFLSGDMTSLAGWAVQGIAVATGDADVVYQACGVSYAPSDPNRGIWKSLDGGESWSQVKSGLNFSGNDEPRMGGECLVIRPGNDNEVWAGARGAGLWRTTDAGANWNRVDGGAFTNMNLATVLLDPDQAGFVWVGGEGGLWLSRDNGLNWTKLRTMTKVWRVVRKPGGPIFVCGTEAGAPKLHRVTASDWNNSATYTFTDRWGKWLDAFEAARGWRPGDDNPLLTVLADGRIVAAALFTHNAVSANNGDSWTLLPMQIDPAGPQPGWQYSPLPGEVWGGRNDLKQDPTDASRWFLAAGYGPMVSADAGAHWRYALNGIGEVVTWKVRFHPSDPGKVFFPMADLGMALVTDAGDSGSVSGFIAKHFPWPDDNTLFAHTVLANSGSRLIALGGEQSTHRPRLYQSADNGASWSKISPVGLPTGNGREIVDAVAARDDADEFLVFTGGAIGIGSGGLYRTTDAGANFVQATGLPNGYDVGNEFYWDVDLEADAADMSKRYLFLRNHGFYRSTNRGASWTKPAAQPRRDYARIAADAIIGGRVWAGFLTGEAGVGLDASADGGTSWSPVAGFDEVADIDANDGRVAVIAKRSGDTYFKIYYSGDNGASWDEITRPRYRFASTQAVAVDPWRPGTIWISTGGRSIARFTPWTPLQSWRHQHFGNPANSGIGADSEDADSDGSANLEEYALGTNPLAFTVSSIEGGISAVDGVEYYKLVVPRAARRPDVSYKVELSPDLIQWASEGMTTILTDTATLLEVQDNTPMSSLARRFLRLRITNP